MHMHATGRNVGAGVVLEGESEAVFLQKIKKSLAAMAFSYKRVMGIEPTLPAWKAGVLPLNYTRITESRDDTI